ncbi:MAG: hypothetical protein RQ753_06385 [Desulfurivibrionaceae bacterium]|nr:hypothetical protein [Desulfurivibrionaceae bacterium]
MLKRFALALPLLLLLSSCGPIIGQLMKVSEGVKDFRVTAGDLGEIARARNILVAGPFAREAGAYYIARGDEAGMFFQEINNTGKLDAELYVGKRYGDLTEMVSSLRSMSPEELKDEVDLPTEPDLVLFGTILERKTIVAPARGIIMRVGYRLEFYNPATNGSTVIEITVKDRFRDCVKLVVAEVLRRAEIAGEA